MSFFANVVQWIAMIAMFTGFHVLIQKNLTSYTKPSIGKWYEKYGCWVELAIVIIGGCYMQWKGLELHMAFIPRK